MNLIDKLANELWLEIICRVAFDDVKSVLALSLTCRSLNELIDNESIWKSAFIGLNQKLSISAETRSYPRTSDLPKDQVTWRSIVLDQYRFNIMWANIGTKRPTDKKIHDSEIHLTYFDICIPLTFTESINTPPNHEWELFQIRDVVVNSPPPSFHDSSHPGMVAFSCEWLHRLRPDLLWPGYSPDYIHSYRLVHLLNADSLVPLRWYKFAEHVHVVGWSQIRLVSVDASQFNIILMGNRYEDQMPGIIRLIHLEEGYTGRGTEVAHYSIPHFINAIHCDVYLQTDGSPYNSLVYQLIIETADQLIIQKLCAKNLTKVQSGLPIDCGIISTYKYDTNFPDIVVTGDFLGWIKVWNTNTGILKYAFQVGKQIQIDYLILRPYIRPIDVLGTKIWRSDQFLQVLAIVASTLPEVEEERRYINSGFSLHAIKLASHAVTTNDQEIGQQVLDWYGLPNTVEMSSAYQLGCLYKEYGSNETTHFSVAWNLLFYVDFDGNVQVTDLATSTNLEPFTLSGLTVQQVAQYTNLSANEITLDGQVVFVP